MDTDTTKPPWAVDVRNDRYATPRALRTYRNRAWLANQLRRGKTLKKIARQADVTASTIELWRRRHNLLASTTNARHPHLSDHALATYANKSRLRSRLEQGKTFEEIAREAAVSSNTIFRWRKSLGLYMPRSERHSIILQALLRTLS